MEANLICAHPPRMTVTEADQLLIAFATTLRRLRHDADLSQEELAHRAGKSIRYISLLESCKHQPSLDTIKGICDGLDMKISAFFEAVEKTDAFSD